MNHSVYDVLHVRPKLHKKLPRAQEALAQAIVASGRMRLDADDECNFTRLLLPEERVNLTFTHREMLPLHLAASRARLMAFLLKRHDNAQAEALASRYLENVKEALSKCHPVKLETEIHMARALVLCNATAVIRLIHLEGAEIFISFGHAVGDVMDIDNWRNNGENSGLQAVGGGENAVYVSCGGHPFLTKEEFRHSGDGFPALARFMIIAGQETGHNGDMIRSQEGRWVGRYSAVDWDRAPSEKAGKGRLSDIGRCESWFDICQRRGLNRIIEWERHVKFYDDHKLMHFGRFRKWLISRMAWEIFKLWLRLSDKKALTKLQRDRYPATLLRVFFLDMLANLSPEAEVYRRKNPKEEEAIACIEAVARVPQQVNKWGHAAVCGATPKLYAFYYGKIVPACAAAAQRFPIN